jgi:hypothetical protein
MKKVVGWTIRILMSGCIFAAGIGIGESIGSMIKYKCWDFLLPIGTFLCAILTASMSIWLSSCWFEKEEK